MGLAACKFKDSTHQRETTGYGSMLAIMTALTSYRDAYPSQGYPETLAALGPPPAGSGANAKAADLIDAALASGERSGYRFLYIPGSRGANGVIDTFALTARPLKYEGPETPSFFVTETGIIRQTTADRAATDVDPPIK